MAAEMPRDQLVEAIQTVLLASNYDLEVATPFLVARRRAAPIPETLYIVISDLYFQIDQLAEAQAAFADITRQDRDSRLVIVTSYDFTPRCKEKAAADRVICWTYSEFRRQFIATSAYERTVLGPTTRTYPVPVEPNVARPLWKELEDLENVYQEPRLVVGASQSANADALEWFDAWLGRADKSWVSLIGDYGSGKTALTKILLLRWMRRFATTGRYLPIRIELRDFATKFDFEGLLIHFWKKHSLDSLPLRSLEMMIAEGRVVFLLDGYDEMAQNLSLMDRRNCLVAIANAISGKSPGIITSRPNYFTQAEELRVVELLYKRGTHLHRLDELFAAEEEKVDAFLHRYYYQRNESRLVDLSSQQVDALLDARLSGDPEILQSVRDILGTIYGMSTTPGDQALGTKPVIVTYILEIAENLEDLSIEDYRPLDDYGIYRLILDRLIRRDQSRTSGIVTPGERRQFLQTLAVTLSAKRLAHADRKLLLDFVHRLFGRDIRRLGELEAGSREELYFADLRSSSSLTSRDEQWFFSHNSLREFLTAEALVETLLAPVADRRLSITDFVGVRATQGLTTFLATAFNHHEMLKASVAKEVAEHQEALLNIFVPVATSTSAISFSDLVPTRRIRDVILSELILNDGKFDGWRFESVIFDRCGLKNSTIANCQFVDCEFADCDLSYSRFEECALDGVHFDSVRLVDIGFSGGRVSNVRVGVVDTGDRILEGVDGSAFLAWRGAILAGNVPALNTWQFHPRWRDFSKVIGWLLADRSYRQYAGLTQRGGVQDPSWARDLVDTLVNAEICEQEQHGNVRLKNVPAANEFLSGELPEFVTRLFR